MADITGDNTSEVLNGTNDDDVINGLDGNDTLNGLGGNDQLIGGAGNDSFAGGDGNDTMIGGEGADAFQGNGGADVVSYEDSDEGVEVQLRGGVTRLGKGGTAEGDAIGQTVDGLIGSAFDDIFYHNVGNQPFFDGGDGIDRLVMLGNQALTNDKIQNLEILELTNGLQNVSIRADQMAQFNEIAVTNVGGSTSRLIVEMGDETELDLSALTMTNFDGEDRVLVQGDADGEDITGTQAKDDLDGNDGNDTLRGAGGNDKLFGDGGEDQLFGGDGDDSLAGGNNNDTLNGGAGDDVLDGNAGDDIYIGGEGADTIGDSGGGGDFASYEDSDEGVTVVLRGGAGREGKGGTAEGDVIGGGIDGFIGSAFDDIFITSLEGSTRFIGGEGTDRVVVEGNLDLRNDILDSIEEIEIVNGADITLTAEQAEALERIIINDIGGSGDVVININAEADRDTPVDLSHLELVDLGSQDVFRINGTTASEEITGTQTSDFIDDADGGADTFFGLGGDDRLVGDAANDHLYGGDGDDFVRGGSGADELYGGNGDDTLIGDSSEDFIEGGAGADSINGGTEFDVAGYANSDAAVQIDLNQSQQTGGHAEGDQLSGIDGVIGSDHDDSLTANAGNNRLVGGLGNDTLLGLNGRDTLRGGAGDDSLEGGNDNDMISGGNGDDTLSGGAGKDRMIGGAGNDLMKTGSGDDDFLSGGAGDDTFMVEGGQFNTLAGGSGFDIATYESFGFGIRVNLTNFDDSNSPMRHDLYLEIEEIRTTNFDDVLIGDAEDNRFQGLDGADRIDGRAGNDTAVYDQSDEAVDIDLNRATQLGGHAEGDRLFSIENVVGSAFDDTLSGNRFDNKLIGGAGNDILNGRRGDDLLQGGEGNDTLVAGPGDDQLDGGTGVDTAVFAGNRADYTALDDEAVNGLRITSIASGDENIAQGVEFFQFNDGLFAEADLLAVIEPATEGADSIDGTANSDTIDGLGGNDTLRGLGGDDSLLGGTGSDTLNAGSGNDTVVGGNGRDTAFLGDGADLFIDNAQGGEFGRDTVFGGAGNDTINGGNGNDEFRGGDGEDSILGRLGNDEIFGGAGADIIDAGDGNDTVAGGNGSDSVELGAGADVFIDDAQTGAFAQDTVFGGAGNDTINGGGGNDEFNGGDGADSIGGGDGNDLLSGGTGFDVINAGAGNDTVFGGDGRDTVQLGNGNDLFRDNAQGGSFGSDIVDGGAGNDTIQAFGGANQIDGGAGDDSIQVIGGSDTLTGGDGEDTFVFFNLTEDSAITDLDLAEDLVILTDADWSAPLDQATLDARSDSSSGSLVLSMDDGTRLTFENLTSNAGLLDVLLLENFPT